MDTLVTPLTPYFLCHHYIATEIHKKGRKYVGMQLDLKANDLLQNNNYDDIKDFDIIQIQVDFFLFSWSKYYLH